MVKIYFQSVSISSFVIFLEVLVCSERVVRGVASGSGVAVPVTAG